MTYQPDYSKPFLPEFLTYSPDERMRWGWRHIGIALGVVLVTFGLTFVAALVLPLDHENDDVVNAFGFFASVVVYGALIAVIAIVARRRGIGSLAADFGLRFRPADIVIGLGLGLLMRMVYFVIAAVTITVSGHVPESGNFDMPTAPLWIVLNGVVLAVLLAPFAEELFFRGLLLRTVRNHALRRGVAARRAIVLAVGVSGAGFALAHMNASLDGVFLVILGLSTLALGIANGVVTVLTGRLGGAILSHVTFNGIGIALALAFGG